MPYKCVHCEKSFADGSKEVVSGCDNCHSRFFFYIKEEKFKQLTSSQESQIELTSEEKKQVEKDMRDIAGISDVDTPIFLDFESIKVIKPGKYVIDLTKLFNTSAPRVYQIEDGKYIIDIASQKITPSDEKS